MNKVVEEMKAILNQDELMHYGMPRRSGRYPWGSGDDPYQRSQDFIARVEELKKQGWKDSAANIMEEFGLSTKEYRDEISFASHDRRMLQVKTAKSLQQDGLGATAIGRKMGISESTVRSLLNPDSEKKMNELKTTVDFLKKQADEKGMIDVGISIERELNIPKSRLDSALYYLETREGYPVYGGRMPQPTNPGQFTTQRVLAKPGTEHKEIYDLDKISTINEYISRDGGDTYMKKFTYPESMDSKRMMVRYAEDGGIDRDGVVELRRGVKDLSLGNSRYSQVRILVDGTHYIKGMAVYSDDLPAGVDVVFNTNKKKGTPKLDVLKTIKDDPDNPFGSAIKDAQQGGQYWYEGRDGKKKLGLINKRADEGDWSDWKNGLPSQFLGKQSKTMAKQQLDLAKADRLNQFDEINSLTNPTIKKHMLEKFASSCDSAAVHLKAAALPGQKYYVILPINTLKDNEVFAPRYKDGTELALVRYPHGGTFEIPILKVNNKNPDAKKWIGLDSNDGIGINSKNAEQLSGADFDGDTVMAIPTNDKYGRVKITSQPMLKGLDGFDPKLAYPEEPGMKYMSKSYTQKQMGVASNLITDMTLKGASNDELAKAVRHSMVVIDAEKHKLNYKKSEIENDIAALRQRYQRQVDEEGNVHVGGASTLLSRAKSQLSVDKRKGTPKINIKGKTWYDSSKPEGALIYKTDPDLEYTKTKENKRTGEVTQVVMRRTTRSTKMAETDDARKLISDYKTPMEEIYADYANSMKSLANRARVEMVKTGNLKQSKEAKETYKKEVSVLMGKLNNALLNATRERAAMRKANVIVKAKKEANPNMTKEDIKKANQQALASSRVDVGAVSRRERSIKITDDEWKAIQAGAISEHKLIQILSNADVDDLRQRAMPKATTELSSAKINTINAMKNSNYTLAQIAERLGVSTSTVSKYLKG